MRPLTQEDMRRKMDKLEDKARKLAAEEVRRQNAEGGQWPDPDETDPLLTLGWPTKEALEYDYWEQELRHDIYMCDMCGGN
jgi:hypothetical protein